MTFPERLHKPGWKVIGAIFLVALIMTGAWGARAAARQMAFFRVRSVEVRGVRYLQPSEVLSRLKVDTLMSLWDDLEPLRERVRHHPQVTGVTITRKVPGTLVVTVQENQPVALIQGAGGLVPYDSVGHELPIDPARTILDLPIVATIDPVLLKLVGAIRYTEPRLFSRIEEVRRKGRDEILLTLSRSYKEKLRTPNDSAVAHTGTLRVRIPLGLSVERLADIFPVENDLARRQLHVGELDLRYRDQVIARLQ
ncbi:MAG: FtsQ-type POTRA domain-containing protein [Gemmatimonadota bacterium]|nr:FtsQ-type POTRA domain-containing protein [Gemmatimonadota bacterium]